MMSRQGAAHVLRGSDQASSRQGLRLAKTFNVIPIMDLILGNRTVRKTFKPHLTILVVNDLIPVVLLAGGMFLPLFTRSATLGTFWRDVIVLPMLRDSAEPVRFTLTGVIATLLRDGEILVGCLATLCFCLIPILDLLSGLRRHLGEAPLINRLDRNLDAIRSWGLLPVLLLGLAIVTLKQAKEGAVIELDIGFYVIAAALAWHAMPIWGRGLITFGRWLRNPRRPLYIKVVHPVWPSFCLSLVSLMALIIGLSCPFFRLDMTLKGGTVESVISRFASVNKSNTFSILGGIRLLWEHGDWEIVGILILASVIFPFAKSFALLWFLHAKDRPQLPYLKVLKRLGPWSMLDAVVVMLLAVAYVGFPGGTSLTLLWAYWVFVISIVLNSIALGLTRHQAVVVEHPIQISPVFGGSVTEHLRITEPIPSTDVAQKAS